MDDNISHSCAFAFSLIGSLYIIFSLPLSLSLSLPLLWLTFVVLSSPHVKAPDGLPIHRGSLNFLNDLNHYFQIFPSCHRKISCFTIYGLTEDLRQIIRTCISPDRTVKAIKCTFRLTFGHAKHDIPLQYE